MDADLVAPAEGPRFEVAEDELRRALAAQPEGPSAARVGSYFEYFAALRAKQSGDAETMRAAILHLQAFDQRYAGERYLAADRGVLGADLRRRLGDLAGALAAIEDVRIDDSLPAADAAEQRSYRACVHAEVLRELGRLDSAIEQVRIARAEAFASQKDFAIAAALLTGQSLALTVGHFEESIAALRQQLRELGPERSAIRSLVLVHLGYAESGRAGMDREGLERAMAALDAARAECDSASRVRVDLKRFDVALRGGNLDLAARVRAECEADLGAAATAASPTRDAEEFATLCARLVLAGGSAVDSKVLVAQRDRQREVLAALAREWTRQPAQRSGIGFLQLGRRREVLAAGIGLELAAAARLGRTDGPEQAMQRIVDLHSCTALARVRGAAACTVREVQEQLPAGGAVLAFVPTRSLTHVLLVEKSRVDVAAVDGNVAGDAAVQELLAALSEPPVQGAEDLARLARSIEGAARKAFTQCIPEGLREAVQRATALTIVGADMCGGLPFEVLMRDDGRLLGEVAAVDNCPSLPLAVAITRAAKLPSFDAARVLFVGCTAPKAALAEVAFALPKAEIEAGLRPFAAANVVRRYDDEATLAGFGAETLSDYSLVHLLMHLAPGDAGAEGGLQFYDGVLGRLDLEVVSEARRGLRASGPQALLKPLPPDRACAGVVVVSACGAGRGPSRVGEGDGFHSFAGSFLWSGAQCVITSRRDLLALAHLRTMARCQQALAQGESPARAMQLARKELAEGSDLVARAHRSMVQVFGAGQVPILRR